MALILIKCCSVIRSEEKLEWVSTGASAEGWTSTSELHCNVHCTTLLSGPKPTPPPTDTQTETGHALFVFDCLTQAYHYYFCLSIKVWSGRNQTEWDRGLSESQRQQRTNCQHLESNRRARREDVNNGGMEITDNAGNNQMLWHHRLIPLWSACMLLLFKESRDFICHSCTNQTVQARRNYCAGLWESEIKDRNKKVHI